MLSTGRVAVVVTTGDAARLLEMAGTCRAVAETGAGVRVFFRDESIPAIARADVATRLLPPELTPDEASADALQAAFSGLASAEDTRLYACSSSLYVWGIGAADLVPAIAGARGLIAFLAEDLAGASRVLTY